jgi:hypothetical protein
MAAQQGAADDRPRGFGRKGPARELAVQQLGKLRIAPGGGAKRRQRNRIHPRLDLEGGGGGAPPCSFTIDRRRLMGAGGKPQRTKEEPEKTQHGG